MRWRGCGCRQQWAEVGELLADSRADLQRAEAARVETAVRASETMQALRAHPPLDALEAAAAAHDRIARGHVVQADRTAAVATARTAATLAVNAVAVAERAEADARAALDDVRHAHAAHDLAAHLTAGEPCPVCEQAVVVVPRRRRPAAVAASERRLDGVLDRRRQAQDAAASAADALHRAEAEVAKVEGMLATLSEQVATHPDADVLAARLAEVRDAVATATSARADDEQAAKALAAARDVVARLDRALVQAADAFHAQRDAIAVASPPPPGTDVLASWQALAVWAGREVGDVVARAQADEATADAASAAHDRLLRDLVRRAGALGVVAPVRADGLAAAVIRAEEQAAQAVREVEGARVDAARLAAEVVTHDEIYAVAHDLGRHMSSSGFPRWLVTEALDLLVADASLLLLRLSEGKYSLVTVDDGSDLGVIDHANADEVRPVRSLSGGETFQASLAFALALSDHLASLASTGASRLDAIFLDEGFGTLDADSLDTVAATIEALGGGGRMVGIVTHVRELAERIAVRYVVAKGPRSATVERVVA